MAVCPDCEQEMLQADTCTADALILHGQRYARRRTRSEAAVGGRCGDCGVAAGGIHHLGCDLETCPPCRGQLLTCGCGWADDGTESIVVLAGDTVVYPAGLRGQVPPGASEPRS